MLGSAQAVSAICSLRNGAETAAGRLLYASIGELVYRYSLTGVTCLHAGGCYRGSSLRGADSEIGSNELALSLLLHGNSSDFQSWLGYTAGLLRGRGVVTVMRRDERNSTGGAHTNNAQDNWASDTSSIFPDFSDGSKMDIYVMESRQSGGTPMYQRIVETLCQRGAVWVSVTRAMDGFGMARSVKKTGWLWKRSEVPLTVTAVGTTEALQEAAADFRRLSGFDGYVTVQPVSWYAP